MNFFFSRNRTTLRCRDIPRKIPRELEAETYPQKSNPIPAMEIARIASRYGPQIHRIIDNLPLSEKDIDRLVMPAINYAIRLMHLLPASESHHHSGLGGLLLHSLESASIAIRLAEQKTFDNDLPLEEKFHCSNRWIVAAALLLLVHDLGKICDMRITDANGCIWNPNVTDLSNWLLSSEIDSYFVDWTQDRVHHSHERKSLRFFYQRILTEDMVSYFTADATGRVLDAIEDAILLNEGVLADVLREADSQSVSQDLARRKNLPSDATYVSSPLVTPLIATIRENIESQLWKINTENAAIYVTTLGVLLKVENQIGHEVRKTALSLGYQNIPIDIDAQLQILAQNGFIETNTLGSVVYLNVEVCNQHIACVRFLKPERIFPRGLPDEVLAALTKEKTADTQEKENAPLKIEKSEMTDYSALLKQSLENNKAEIHTKALPALCSAIVQENLPPITSTEYSEVLDVPLEKEKATLFAQRLFSDAFKQLAQGSGMLISNRRETEKSITCSSVTLEQIATNHGISNATLEAIFHTLQVGNQLNFDAHNHLVEVLI